MSRRFWIVALLSVLAIGAIVAMSIASANGDDDEGYSVDKDVDPYEGAAPLAP
ncbi:hypothetical protein [Rubrivirga sp.]|uniref:hypothetical protein n=1 Tax=Rubrivirga sp. TaxID=1885344 RepID=UPI003B52D880